MFVQGTTVSSRAFLVNSYQSLEMYQSTPLAEAPFLVIKISKKTSPQHLGFCSALKQSEMTLTDLVRKKIHATREQYPRKNWVP